MFHTHQTCPERECVGFRVRQEPRYKIDDGGPSYNKWIEDNREHYENIVRSVRFVPVPQDPS